MSSNRSKSFSVQTPDVPKSFPAIRRSDTRTNPHPISLFPFPVLRARRFPPKPRSARVADRRRESRRQLSLSPLSLIFSFFPFSLFFFFSLLLPSSPTRSTPGRRAELYAERPARTPPPLARPPLFTPSTPLSAPCPLARLGARARPDEPPAQRRRAELGTAGHHPPAPHLPWTRLPRYAPPPTRHVACTLSPPRHRAAPTAISAAELAGRPTTTAPPHPCSARPINRPPRGPSPP